MALKGQDVAVVLKLCASRQRLPYHRLAVELSMSPSEVHAAVKRAQGSRLLFRGEFNERPNRGAVEEFLIHGLKYAFPAEHGGATRGVLTSYAAAPLRELFASDGEPPPVWPYAEGKDRGLALQPLYERAPEAALRDPLFYEYLVLADVLRDGRSRERKLAVEMLVKRLRSLTYEQPEP